MWSLTPTWRMASRMSSQGGGDWCLSLRSASAPPGGCWRPCRPVRDRPPFGQPGPGVTRSELQALLDEAGLDARITKLAWSGRYRLQHRLAARMRHGRLFLVGDAAHAFSPATGQGMNTGIQDAINLGWKLAFAPTAADRESLLDSYDRERRQVARATLALTQVAFWLEASTGPLPALLRSVVAPLGAPRCRPAQAALAGRGGYPLDVRAADGVFRQPALV